MIEFQGSQEAVFKHIDKLNSFAGTLYRYICTLRNEMGSRKEKEASLRRDAKEAIDDYRKVKRANKIHKAYIIEVIDLLRDRYSVDVNALETAEEL
jgi:hypothetical protein